ncbi:MAG: hypothetical protein LBB88_06720 [Planctomycetaceae bacterium]|jgi:hypothetical protein|nr:hypothetical protein [Planctomycetaceae bacterium]
MKSYHPIFLIKLFLIAVIFCVSCSRQDGKGDNNINIFKPDRTRIDQYSNRGTKGTTKTDVGTMSRSLRDVKYENDNETVFGYLTAVIGFIALIAVAVIFERYLAYRMKTTADSPSALFIELCAGHQLTRMERNLIEQVAKNADINDPLPIFIEPKYLINAINKQVFQNSQQAIEYLLAKLFESKSESSIIKRSSILLQSESNNDLSSGIRSGITDTTIAYEKSHIKSNNPNNSTANTDSSTSAIEMQTSVIPPQNTDKSVKGNL